LSGARVRAGRAAFLAVLVWCATARAEPPTVTSIAPQAVAPGKTVELTLRGSALDGPVSLWTSFPAEAKVTASANDHVTYWVAVPADVPVGPGALRVATKDGVSTVVPLMVDDLLTSPGREGVRGASAAQELSLPAAVDGACEPLASALDQRGARLALIWSRSASVAARAAVLKLSPELAYRIARDELMMRPVPSDV